jgi:hypothetical protein
MDDLKKVRIAYLYRKVQTKIKVSSSNLEMSPYARTRVGETKHFRQRKNFLAGGLKRGGRGR